METNNSVAVLQQKIDMLYREYNLNVCGGCKFEHNASCDMADRLPHCQQQLLKYNGYLGFYKKLHNGKIKTYSI